MEYVVAADLQCRGFRFLSEGSDANRFDAEDVIADRDGEVIYEPGMRDCYEAANNAFASIARTGDGSFTCFPKAYIYRDYFPVIKDWRTRSPERVVTERQRAGFAAAMEAAPHVENFGRRAMAYIEIAASMAMARQTREAAGACDALCDQIRTLDDADVKKQWIIRACIELGNKIHVDGLGADLFERLLALAGEIGPAGERAIASTFVIATMAEHGCPVSEKEHVLNEAVETSKRIGEGRNAYLARIEVARYVSWSGFADRAAALYDEIIAELRSCPSKTVSGSVAELFRNIRYARMGFDDTYDLFSKATHLLDPIEKDEQLVSLLDAVARAIPTAAQDARYSPLFDELRNIAGGIGRDELRAQALRHIDGAEKYVFEP